MNVYEALLRDGKEKRARMERPAESVDSLPTTAKVWELLRAAYGPRLVGATVVAIVDNDGHVTVQTLTVPAVGAA